MDDIWSDIPILSGKHIILRPMVREDGAGIVKAASDGKLWELIYATVPNAEQIESYLDLVFQAQAAGRSLPFVVIDKANGNIIGSTRYLRMNRDARRLEIGATFYAESYQRSGVNSEAKLLLLSHAFEIMDCQCVQFRTDYLNQRSQRAIERLGAKRDGILRGHSYMKGRLRDTVVYSILAHEWEGVKRNLQMRLARG